MTTRFFTHLLCTILFFGCSKDEFTTQSITEREVNQEIDDTRSTFNNCASVVCDTSYVFPTPEYGQRYNTIQVYYDSNMITEEEIFCIRFEYFMCYGEGLTFPLIQSSDPFNEIWKIIQGRPDDDVTTAQCSDPRFVNSPACAD